MKKFTILAAAAPLALLAACGDNDAGEDTGTETAEMGAADTDTAAAGSDMDGSEPATQLADAGDFSGTYNFTRPDGSTSAIKLNSSDGTYEYTDAKGTLKSGEFTRMEDGYRVSIADYNGVPAFFTISGGNLFRVDSDFTLDDNTPVTGERYDRDGGPVQGRDPELGSQIPVD